MTSSINPNNINGNYPIAGQDNDSQGFRDNFTNVINNLTYAKQEIEDLQNKAVLVTALNGSATPANNMDGTVLYAAQLQDSTYAVNQLVATSGAITLDYSLGYLSYTTINAASGSVVLSFGNWPSESFGYAVTRLYVSIADSLATYSITLPTSVSVGIADVEGSVSNIITFPYVGNYLFEFSSYDGGNTIIVQDLLRNYETQLGNAVTFITAAISSNLSVGGTLTTNGARVLNGFQYNSAATSGQTISITTNVEKLMLDPTIGALSSLYVTLPTGNVAGQTISISSTANIANLVVRGNNGTVTKPNANISLGAGTSTSFLYHGSESTWYKIG